MGRRGREDAAGWGWAREHQRSGERESEVMRWGKAKSAGGRGREMLQNRNISVMFLHLLRRKAVR